jgi:hypothetical protein
MKTAAATIKKPSIPDFDGAQEIGDSYTPKADTQELLPKVKSGSAKKETATLRITDTGKRSFVAPEGHRRLTINIRNDLYKKLAQKALDEDTDMGKIIAQLVDQHLK